MPAIGLASTSVIPSSTIYGTPQDPSAVIQMPDKLKSVTVTIDTSISKNGTQVRNTLAHEVGHANDARTNFGQYQGDGQRTKQTKGSTPHDSRPEEKRANNFKDQVNKERSQLGKQQKQQNKQLEDAEKRRIKELEKQAIQVMSLLRLIGTVVACLFAADGYANGQTDELRAKVVAADLVRKSIGVDSSHQLRATRR